MDKKILKKIIIGVAIAIAVLWLIGIGVESEIKYKKLTASPVSAEISTTVQNSTAKEKSIHGSIQTKTTSPPQKNYVQSSVQSTENPAQVVTQPPPVEKKNEISVSLAVGDKKYHSLIAPASTLYDLMNKLTLETDLRFKGKYYTGFGFFVEEINDVRDNWVFEVNGKKVLDAGVSTYILKDGDAILWKISNIY